MRGSFCQALPIGCIRVFMTPSCSSAVTLESRCSGTLNSVSSLRREISKSWLRVKTSSETMVIRCSSVSTLTRIDWLATLSPSAPLGGGLLRRRLGFGRGFLLWRCRGAAAAAAGAGAGDFDRGLLEGALEFIQRHFAGTQFAFQGLHHQGAFASRPPQTMQAAAGADAASEAGADIAAMPCSTISCNLTIRS